MLEVFPISYVDTFENAEMKNMMDIKKKLIVALVYKSATQPNWIVVLQLVSKIKRKN